MMYLLGRGELVSIRSRDMLLDIMRSTVTNTLLPAGLGEGAAIAHKTGDIGTVIGDAGLIDAPNGQRYVAAVMVQRPFNDIRARELVQEISRLMYQSLSQSQPRATVNSPNR
jgi:beta-lactamase class A